MVNVTKALATRFSLPGHVQFFPRTYACEDAGVTTAIVGFTYACSETYKRNMCTFDLVRANDFGSLAVSEPCMRCTPVAPHPAVIALHKGSLGISFSGSGFGTAYQLGVAQRLSELGVISSSTPVSGSSAGIFPALATRCGIPYENVLESLESACQELISVKQFGRVESVLSAQLDELLPKDAWQLCSDPGLFTTAATRVKGPLCLFCWRPEMVSEGFSSQEHLKSTLLTSCFLPLVSDGKRFTRKVNGRRYIDSAAKQPVVPIQGVKYTIMVFAIPNYMLNRLWPYRMVSYPPPPERIDISPGQYAPWPYNYKQSQKRIMQAQEPAFLDALFERGRLDAQRWAVAVGLSSGAIPLSREVREDLQDQLLGCDWDFQ